MKSLFILIAVFSVATFVAPQDPPPNIPDLPDVDLDIIFCIGEAIASIPDTTGVLVDWTVDTFNTVWRLLEEYRRCQAISNSILQNACMASWTIDFIFSANRIRNDLAVLTDPETADAFIELFYACFNFTPETSPAKYY